MKFVDFPSSGFSNLNWSTVPNDFTFVVGRKIYSCPRILADILSPKLSKMHLIDPTVDSFTISINDPSENFQFFIDLISIGKSDITPKKISFVLDVCNILDNTELFSRILNQSCDECAITMQNIEEKLSYIDYLAEDSDEFEKIIEFASSNFSEISHLLKSLSYETLAKIFSTKSLFLESEDSLLNFILSLISKHGDEFLTLLSYVDFVHLSVEGVNVFLQNVSSENITQDIWESMCARLLIDTSRISIKREADMSYEEENEFNLRSSSSDESFSFMPSADEIMYIH